MQKSSAKQDEGKKSTKTGEKNRSRSPSARRSDELGRDEDEQPRKKTKRRKSRSRGSKVGGIETPPSVTSEQKARRQTKSATDDEPSPLPKDINFEYFEQVGDNLQRAQELLDEHARTIVFQTAEVIACIPEYIPPRRYTTKLCRCNTCCERCCVDPEHRLTGFHSNFKDAATDVPDEEGLTLSSSSDTSGLSLLGDISDVGDDGKPRVSARLAAAAREVKRAMRLARQFRSAARTMDSLECSNDSEHKMRCLYTKELMDKAAFYATKANEALSAYGVLRRTLRKAADVSGPDDATRFGMNRDRRSPYMSMESQYLDRDSPPRSMYGSDSRQRYSSDSFARQYKPQPGLRPKGYRSDGAGGSSGVGRPPAVQAALSLARRADMALSKAQLAADEAQRLQRVSDEALAEAKAIEGLDDSTAPFTAKGARAGYRLPGAVSEPDQRSSFKRAPDPRISGRVGFDEPRAESVDSRALSTTLGIVKPRATDTAGDLRQPRLFDGETPSKASSQAPRIWGDEKGSMRKDGKSDLESDLSTQITKTSGLRAPRPSIAPIPKHRAMRRASVSAALASQIQQRSTKAALRRASVSSLDQEYADITSPQKGVGRRASVSSLQQELSDVASPRKAVGRRASVSSLQEPSDLASPRKGAARKASVSSIPLELSDVAQPPQSRKTKSLAARRASVGAGLLLKLGAQSKESSDSSVMSPEREKQKTSAGQDSTFKSKAARRASVTSAGNSAEPLAEDLGSFKAKAARRASVSLKRLPAPSEGHATDQDSFKARAQRRASVSSKDTPRGTEVTPEEQETFKARATRRASVSGSKAPLSTPDDQDFKVKAARRASVSSKVISPAIDSRPSEQDSFKAKTMRRASVSAKAYAPDVPSDEQDSFKAKATRRASVSAKGLSRPRAERGSRDEKTRRASVSSSGRDSSAEGSTPDSRKAKAAKTLTLVEPDVTETLNKPGKKIPRRASVCAAKYKRLYGDISGEECKKEGDEPRRASELPSEPFKNLKVRRSSLSASKLPHDIRKTGFDQPEAVSTPASAQGSRQQSAPASAQGSRRQSVSKDKDSVPEDKGGKEAAAVTMSKEMLFSRLRDCLGSSAAQKGAVDKDARGGGQIVVKIKPLPVPVSSKKVGTRCDPKEGGRLCEEFDFDTCASGSREPKEIQKIIDEGVGTPKYTKDMKRTKPDKNRTEIFYELSEQSLDIEIIPSQRCKEAQISLPFDEPLSKPISAVTSPEKGIAKEVPVKRKASQTCKETQVSLPFEEPLFKASSAVTAPENDDKDVSVKKKLDTTGAEDEGKGMKGDLSEHGKKSQKQGHGHKVHKPGSRHIPAEKELSAKAQDATEDSKLRKPSANVVTTTDGDSKARNLDSGPPSKAQKDTKCPSKKTSSEDKGRADSHGGGSRSHLKILPSDTYVFTATAAVIAGGDARNPTAMLAAPEDANPKAKGKKPDKARRASKSSHENVNEAGTKKRRESSQKQRRTPPKGSPENTREGQKPTEMPEQAEKEPGEKRSDYERNRDGEKEERATDKPESESKRGASKGQEAADKNASDRKTSMKKIADKEGEVSDQPEAGSKRKASNGQDGADQKVSDRKSSMKKYKDKEGEMPDQPKVGSKPVTDQEGDDQNVSGRKASVKKYEDKQGLMLDQPETGSKRMASRDQESAHQKVSDRKASMKKYKDKEGEMFDKPDDTGERAKDKLKSEQATSKEVYEETDEKKSNQQAQASGIKTMQLPSADDVKYGDNKTEDNVKPSESPQKADVIKQADEPLVDDANAPAKPQASMDERTGAKSDTSEGVERNLGVPESSSAHTGDEGRTQGITEDKPKSEDPQRASTDADATTTLKDSDTEKKKEGTESAVSREESRPEPPQEILKTIKEQRANVDDTTQGRVSVANVGDVGNQEDLNMRADSTRDNRSLVFTEKPSMTAAASEADIENTERGDVGGIERFQKSTEFIVPKALAFGSVGDNWTAQTPNIIEPIEITESSKDLKSVDSYNEGTTVEATTYEGTDGDLEAHEQQDIAEDNLPQEDSPPDLQPEEEPLGDLLEEEPEEQLPEIPEEAVADERAVFDEDGEIEPNEEREPALQDKQVPGLQQNVIELQNVDFELQSRPHARLRGPDMHDFNFWDLDGPPIFYPESRLVFAVALVASVWILYLLFQTRLNTNRKPFFEPYTALATGPEVPRARIMTEPLAVDEFSNREAGITEAGIIVPTEPRFLYSCDTPYCKEEASYLSQVLGDDPCVNFYGYVCNKQARNWNPMIGSSISADAFIVNKAAKLTAGYILNKEHAGMKTARNLLEACLDHERDDDWSRTELNELFFDYFGSSWPTENKFLTMEAVWVIAGRLARDLKLEALARVSVDKHPEDSSATVPSIGEPVLLYRRDDFSEPEYCKMLESAAEQTATFMNPAANGRQIASEARKTTELLADMISNDSARSFAMQGYRLSTVRVLEPGVRIFLRTVFLDSLRVADNSAILVKSPQFFENLEGTKGSRLDPQAVLNYIGFRVMIYFSAFLPQSSIRRLRALEANFMLPDNASIQDFCTREIERVFPAIYARAFVLQMNNFSASLKVRTSELKGKFVQGLEGLTWIAAPNASLEPDQGSVARHKLESLTVEDAVPPWVLNNPSFEQYTEGLERQLEVTLNLDPSNSLKRFCLFAKLLRQQELQQALLEGLSANQTALSVFETETWYDAQNDKIHVPLAVVDWSVPTESIAFVIHAARYGVRVFKALVRGLLPDYAYTPGQRAGARAYSQGYRERLSATVRCLLRLYENASKTVKSELLQRVTDRALAGIALLEQSVALMQAYSVFKDLLRARRVWHSDFRLAGIPRLTSDQLFFVAYARDNCEASDRVRQRRRWLNDGLLPPEDRVNFPLAQFDAFARAFTCNRTAPMAASGHCPLVRSTRQ